MDFRISRIKQPQEIVYTRGLNVVKEKDYTKTTISWKDGITKDVYNIPESERFKLEAVIKRRNVLTGIALSCRKDVEAGAFFTKDLLEYASKDDTFNDYSILSGIISEMGNNHIPNPIAEDSFRICWYGNIKPTDFNGDFLSSIHSRWDDMAVGCLLSSKSINFGTTSINITGNEISEEYSELHLSYVDINIKDMTATAIFHEDRKVFDPFFGYIPTAMGGKPSKLSKVNQLEKYKAKNAIIDLKNVKRLKMRELARIEYTYPVSKNTNYYFEYLKDFGSFHEVSE